MRTMPTGEERKESYIEAEDIFIHVRELNKSSRMDSEHEEMSRYTENWESDHDANTDSDTDISNIPL